MGLFIEKGVLFVSFGELDGLNFLLGGCGGGLRGNEVGGNVLLGIFGCKRIFLGVRLGILGFILGFGIIGFFG